MNQTRQDVIARASGRAHRAAYPSDKRCATTLKVHRSTPNRWANGDRNSPAHHSSLYLLQAENPYQLLAHDQVVVKMKAVQKLTDAQLIERYWELRALEKEIEGQDNANDVRPGVSWQDRAAMKRRDAAVEEELAAVMLEFSARRIPEERVRMGAR